MGHDLSHAIDYISGNMTNWYRKGGEGYRNVNAKLKEYRWEAHNGGTYNNRIIQFYLNEQNLWSKFANFK